MKINDIISESSSKVKWEHYPLDKDTITGWAKLPRGAPGGFKPSKWQDRLRWDQDDKQNWEKSFPKDKPKEVDEEQSTKKKSRYNSDNQQASIYNPNGKTYKGSKNPMPQFDPNDAMMQGDYDQLNTVTATDQGGIDKVESDIDRNRLKDIIRSGMKILTPEEREVLNLRYWHDLDHNKVGKKIGSNTQAVWKIEAKALRKLRDKSNAPEIRRYIDPNFKPKVISRKEVDEAEFNPSRRGFLKKAGAVAASAAIPKGLAGAAMKVATPVASSVTSIMASPLTSLSATGLFEIRDILQRYHGMFGPSESLSAVIDIARDATYRPLVGGFFSNIESSQALLDAVALGKKNNMSNKDIFDELLTVSKDMCNIAMSKDADLENYIHNREYADVEEKDLQPWPSDADLEDYSEDRVNRNKEKLNKKSSSPNGMSSLARAAGAQIGRTMKNVGKTTANAILNHPAKDMGKIEPTTSPIALSAPTVKTGMQIPKQKSKVSAHRKNDEDNKELERLKEMMRRT